MSSDPNETDAEANCRVLLETLAHLHAMVAKESRPPYCRSAAHLLAEARARLASLADAIKEG